MLVNDHIKLSKLKKEIALNQINAMHYKVVSAAIKAQSISSMLS